MKLRIVVPCYNEEEVLPHTAQCLLGVLDQLQQRGLVSKDSGILFVDDGSKDRTWELVESLATSSPRVAGVKLSKNRGHQQALKAGLDHADADVAISMDADLQDDPAAMEPMLQAHLAGADVVYGVRRARDTDSWFKRVSAQSYYRLLALFGVDVVFNHADYRLLSRRALQALSGFREHHLFLRGIVPLLGFPTATVSYDRQERRAGESKYPLHRMLAFAWQGITSFSPAPLRFITALGLVVSLASLAFTAWALWVWMFTNRAVPGWTSTVVPVYFLGGVQLLSIGILGEYIAKIYTESKRRPAYFVERSVGLRPEEANNASGAAE
jgi:polyisoprenyl-phosphate glycosyltransferase